MGRQAGFSQIVNTIEWVEKGDYIDTNIRICNIGL